MIDLIAAIDSVKFSFKSELSSRFFGRLKFSMRFEYLGLLVGRPLYVGRPTSVGRPSEKATWGQARWGQTFSKKLPKWPWSCWGCCWSCCCFCCMHLLRNYRGALRAPISVHDEMHTAEAAAAPTAAPAAPGKFLSLIHI